MQSERENDHQNIASGAWITIGSFDGVHLGHQALIKNIVEESHKSNAPSSLVTFFPHPVKVLRKLSSPYYLTTPEEKDRLLTTLGVDSILTLHFDHNLEMKSADFFIRMLYNQLKFSHLLIGYDFKLGVDRSGDFNSLSKLGEILGYSVKVIKPYKKSSQPVSSSAVREFIKSGNLPAAAEMLGRLYSVEGYISPREKPEEVTPFFTATLPIWGEKLLPKPGVYAAYAISDNQRFPCTASISSRPAAHDQSLQQTVEVHIPDINHELSDQKMRLNFVQRIRSEIKFDSTEDLMVQINKDIQQSREVLAHESHKTNIST